MAKFIDKNRVIAEIDKRLHQLTDASFDSMIGRNLTEIKDFLDTIEVKEVDLDVQTFAKEMYTVFALPSSETNNTEEEPLNWEYAIAKHFFELGLKVNYSITAADRGTAEEIIINLKRVEQDYRINLTKEIDWVRNQIKKGK